MWRAPREDDAKGSDARKGKGVEEREAPSLVTLRKRHEGHHSTTSQSAGGSKERKGSDGKKEALRWGDAAEGSDAKEEQQGRDATTSQ